MLDVEQRGRPMADETEVRPVLRVLCFCGCWVTVGETDRGPVLLHATPACDRFLDTPIDQFLHDIRVHWETHAAPN